MSSDATLGPGKPTSIAASLRIMPRLIDFTPPLLTGRLIKREKRFLAHIVLDHSGEEIVAHCPNTGRMTGALGTGRRVAVTHNDDPNRKLKYTWELAANLPREEDSVDTDNAGESSSQGEPGWTGVNTHRANRIVETAIGAGLIKAIARYGKLHSLKREVPYGERHRADFEAHTETGSVLIEVKNVHMSRTKGIAEFPDAVTERGARHMRAFADETNTGRKCEVVFCVQRDDCSELRLASDIDPHFVDSVRYASVRGVGFSTHAFSLNESGVISAGSLPLCMEI